MTRLVVCAIAVVLLGGSAAQAQTITVTPKTSANNPPVAGQKLVYAKGTYTTMPNQTASKVVAKWYKEVGGNLIYVGEVTDNAPAGGNYTTGEIGVDLRDANNNLLKYTVIVELYVTGNNMSVAGSLSQHYSP